MLSTNVGLINKLDDGSRDENQMDQRRFYRSRGNMSGFNLMVALRYLSEHHQHHQDLSSGHHESLYEVFVSFQTEDGEI